MTSIGLFVAAGLAVIALTAVVVELKRLFEEPWF